MMDANPAETPLRAVKTDRCEFFQMRQRKHSQLCSKYDYVTPEVPRCLRSTLSLYRENQRAGAEGETASETLRPKDRLGDETLWRVVPHAPAEGIAISGKRTEGASNAGEYPLR